jgi:glycosyltransferase involved in cell wall biosynthesis
VLARRGRRRPAPTVGSPGLVRCLERTHDDEARSHEALRCLRDALPLAELSAAEQNYLIDIVRHLVQAHARPLSDLGMAEMAETLASLMATESPSALREWIAASFDLARPDYRAALRRLDEGLTEQPIRGLVALDLHAEKALIYQRYALYGEVAAELALVPPETLGLSSHYRRSFALPRQVAALCAGGADPLRYPECLFDIIFEEIAGRPIRYTPRAGHVAMVSGSLGAGGGERQTITVVGRLLNDPRIETLSLLVRSTHLRPNDGFFLPQVSALPVDLTIYGQDWPRRTDLAAFLPELLERPRLLSAMELLPHHPREEIARLCRLLFDQRPQAVHIWQDIPYAAVACALVGIPHFFIHRGSLAPDYWAQNENQSAVHFRPMRHIYRHLLQRPGFVLLNNSLVGCKTDQTWLAWPNPTPFQVVYNAVDFAQLGENTGRNMTLRRELGVPDDAPLIGGAFRIVPVKRPLYWIEAARQIREAIPNAHFVIIGDGDMTDEVAAYACRHGFSAAMHLPGRVSNVGDWYRAMDLHLLTSEREGLPNALIESQHFGVPIVATAVGGVHEAVDIGQTGYVVDGDNGPTPYAQKVIEVLRDLAWHERACVKAPVFVHEKFNLDRVVEQLLGYYGVDADAHGSVHQATLLSMRPRSRRSQPEVPRRASAATAKIAGM